MPWLYVLLILTLAVTVILSALIAFYAWQKRGFAPWMTTFFIMMCAVAWWTLFYAMEIASPDLASKLAWVKGQYLGIVVLPVAWMVFALQYSGRLRQPTRGQGLLLALIPALTFALALTNETHQWLWREVELAAAGPYTVIDAGYGAWFWVHTAYSYALILVGSFAIFNALAQTSAGHRRYFWFLFLAPVLPWISNLIFILDSPALWEFDLTPSAFMISGGLIFYSIWRFKFLDIKPIAWKTAVKRLPGGLFILDREHRVVDLNPAAERIAGRPAGEVIGGELAFLFAAEEARAQYRALTAAGQSLTDEVRLKGRDYQLQLSLLRDERGATRGRVLLLHDITAHKHAERALRQSRAVLEQTVAERTAALSATVEALGESEAKFRALTELTSAFIFIYQGDGFIYVNPAAEGITGYGRGQLLGSEMWQRLRAEPSVDPLVRALLRDENGSAAALQREIRIERGDGRAAWLELTLGRISFNGETAVLGTAFDITARKRSGEELRKMSLAVAHSPLAVLIYDKRGVIEFVNEKFTENTGFSAAEILGTNAADLGDNDPALNERIRVQTHQGREWHGELYNHRKGEPGYWVAISIAPITNEEGEITHFVEIQEDITARRAAEKRAIEAERLAAVGKIAAALAHEINNPLQKIQSNLDLVLDFSLDEAEARDSLMAIRQEMAYIKEINRRILSFAAVSAPRQEPVQLAELWDEVLRLVGEEIRVREITLTKAYQPVPAVTGAAAQLLQVFMNLLLNAIDAAPIGGWIRIDVYQAAGAVGVKLAYNGAPLPGEGEADLFQPFFSSKHDGAGLGLWISQNILHQHGGEITFHQSVDEEAVYFKIKLPVQTVSEGMGK